MPQKFFWGIDEATVDFCVQSVFLLLLLSPYLSALDFLCDFRQNLESS